jgi:hypothetical protein
VRPRNFAGEDRVITGHVGFRVVRAMFQLDFKPAPELLDVNLCPIDPELYADGTRLLGRE